MKFIKFFSAAVLAALMLAACGVTSPKSDPQPKSITKADVDSASYALGVNLASMVKYYDLGDINLNQVVKGYKDFFKDADSFDASFIDERMNSFMQKRMIAVSEDNLRKGQEFLAKTEKEEGVIKTASGLLYKILESGNGNFPTAIDSVTVNYKLTDVDGNLIESNEGYGPVSFSLEGVIPGWTEGIQKVDEGGKIMLYVPSELAYGENGPVGANQTLVFEVELLEVKHLTAEESKE
jgi:FKBP-type peptidyl-prolyl cis-trans isomerase